MDPHMNLSLHYSNISKTIKAENEDQNFEEHEKHYILAILGIVNFI